MNRTGKQGMMCQESVVLAVGMGSRKSKQGMLLLSSGTARGELSIVTTRHGR